MPKTKRARKPKTARPYKATARQLAVRWGGHTKSAILGNPWFGPDGKRTTIQPIPVEIAAKWGRKAAHYALLHRAKYPLKGAQA